MQRLYEQFIPEHYHISWDFTEAPRKRRIKGHVALTGTQVVEGSIRLHSVDLEIDNVSVNGQEIREVYADHDNLVIPHRGAGRVEVIIDFFVSLSDAMHGIYPCYYEHEGTRRELYATQFESHHAREAFPCIDEPEAKATFDVRLLTAPMTVLSNMPVSSQTERGGVQTTVFHTTPRMSSYLVAFVAGDLQRATTKTKNDVEVNVYATKVHRPEALSWALEHAARTIEYFDEYFGVPYPLPKSDHVALPDFSSGAMENWGLITYREMALLADPATTTISAKRYIAEVVAHELSHQWFGNLVTMKWWDNLWLNESFATIMEYLPPDALHPDWNVWFDFATNEGTAALRRDAIDGVQPVQVEVSHPDEINSLFDGAIVYAKGGRLLRMMQLWIGEDAFRKGLKKYFETYKYENTTGDDLWSCLSEASGKDVSGLMNTWITQPGYPVVTATLQDDTLSVSQTRFFIGPHMPSQQLWPIPLDASDSRLPEIMHEQSIGFPFGSDKSVLLNVGGNGHFITCYDETLRGRILADILAGRLSDRQRAQYLNEQTLLARGGMITSAALVDLLVAFERETSQKVWDMIAIAISDLKRFVETNPDAEKKLRAFVGRLAQFQFSRLGWDARPGEPEEDTELRATILGCMVYAEDPDVLAEAIRRFQATPPEQLNPELRSVIMTAAVRYSGDVHVIDRLLDLYQSTSSSDLKSDITNALTSTRDNGAIARLLKLLSDTKTIRPQDTISWYVGLLRNREGRDAAWRWLREHWPWIEKTFGSDKSHDYFPRYSANILATRTQLDEYREFFTPLKSSPALTRAIDMGILDLSGRIELLERDTDAVAHALASL